MSELNATKPGERRGVWFWVIGLALVVYVAACTVQRDSNLGSDGWEHHRAILTLTRHLWKPGNPTFASDLPSVRYSPYTVFWALVCRATHLKPYDALSIAAVINTMLLVLAVRWLLGVFAEAASAAAVLFVMVTLYGGAPGWANSYALSDLPWHQVNPSAFSFPLVLFCWSLFVEISKGFAGMFRWIVIVVLMTVAVLDHGMTGAFGMAGLFILAMLAPAGVRLRMLAGLVVIVVCVAALCTLWPWYSFWKAALWKGDPQYWFNPLFWRWEMTQWIVPAVGCAICALPLIGRPIIGFCVAGGAVALTAGLIARFNHSPVLARFPLPGLIFFHIMVGIFAQQTGIFRVSTWPARIRSMVAPFPQGSYWITQTLVLLALVCCLVPQLKEIAVLPWLARPYLVRALHRGRDLQERVPEDLGQLLKPVGEHDIVLSDLRTSWLIPSVNGRVVAVNHYELFVPDQRKRWHDVLDFFTPGDSDLHREQVVREYNIRWIVLDGETMDVGVYYHLLRPAAVVAKVDGLVLMDSGRWLAAKPGL
jgi:hypothetical protein